MTESPVNESSFLSEVEVDLKKRFNKEEADRKRMPSTASAAQQSERVVQLTLPDEMRGSMPLTKDKFIIKENPHLVAWEREVRKFLRKLSPEHGHRITAVMIFEWATGITIVDLQAQGTLPNGDLRKINQLLRAYFGTPAMTHICGRKVNKAYRVPAGWYIRRHRPITLTLWAEWTEGSLYP